MIKFYQPQKGISLKGVQEFNRSVILKVIHERGVCSRATISSEIELDQATITRAITQLIEDGIVEEVSLMKGQRGRRSIGLSLDSGRFRVIVVRLQRLSFSVALFDLLGNTLDLVENAIPSQQSPKQTFGKIVEIIDTHLVKLKESIIGIGVSLPGPFLEKDERIILMTESPDWQVFNLISELRGYYDEISIFSNHDAKSAALAVWREMGIALESKVMLYISVGQGVGSGLVVNGLVFKGSQGIAGEVGHTSIDMNGPLCKCGNYGCLELYTSRLALIRSIQQKAKNNSETSLTEDASFADVVSAYHVGDDLAVTEVERVANYLAQGIVNYINLINPDLIILGDEFMAFGDTFLKAVDKSVKASVLPSIYQNIRMQLANIEEDLVLKGSFLYVLEHTLFVPSNVAPGKLMEEGLGI
ncbi:MAG: ROK family transcriptional regulator [SAR324 cluster bacterium]|nr:ROK family transcriptional regulator [SAR324 cluster bacterium]